jgi:hypothetical protein
MNLTITNRRGPFASKSNGGSPYWVVTFKNDEDKSFTTYVDTTMENYSHWVDILHHKDNLILGNLKLKSKKDGIINADSIPKIIGVAPEKVIPKYTPPAANNFNNLFE